MHGARCRLGLEPLASWQGRAGPPRKRQRRRALRAPTKAAKQAASLATFARLATSLRLAHERTPDVGAHRFMQKRQRLRWAARSCRPILYRWISSRPAELLAGGLPSPALQGHV